MNSAPESDAGDGFLERLDRARSEFTRVMDDDFNSPRGIAVLQDLTRDVNTLLNSESEVGVSTLGGDRRDLHCAGWRCAGLGCRRKSDAGRRRAARSERLIEMLIEMRAQARADRDYARSDQIRDQLAAWASCWKIESMVRSGS